MIPVQRESDPRRRLILALDVENESEALRLADSLRRDLAWVKVGLQLYSSAGPDVVKKLASMGLRVFVDLKLHDIPNTMARAAESLCDIGTGMFTCHASAGTAALRQTVAATAARGGALRPPMVLAVTALTSFDAAGLGAVFGREVDPGEEVIRLGRLAVDAGSTGLVASPLEVCGLRKALGPDPVLVIPGIRPAGASTDDQARVATPAGALRDGADYLVVGRPISQADQPHDALLRILDEMAGAE